MVDVADHVDGAIGVALDANCESGNRPSGASSCVATECGVAYAFWPAVCAGLGVGVVGVMGVAVALGIRHAGFATVYSKISLETRS